MADTIRKASKIYSSFNQIAVISKSTAARYTATTPIALDWHPLRQTLPNHLLYICLRSGPFPSLMPSALLTASRAPSDQGDGTAMIRFSLRTRRPERREPPPESNDRAHKPLAKSAFNARKTAPASYLVNYDALPRRGPNGLALSYAHYVPSEYSPPPPQARRTRFDTSHATVPAPPKNLHETPVALDLDAGSLARTAAARNDQDFLPVSRRIAARIADLRALVASAERLGDLEVLKDLVGIHEAKVAHQKHEADTARLQLKEAKIIAGITDTGLPQTDEDRATAVRKVSGKPLRQISGRTISALKTRTASMRSGSRNTPRDDKNRDRTICRGRAESSKLTRKSSARLKRLGSAGSVLIRRLSKVSVGEDASSGSSSEALFSSTFDQETMKRLKNTPTEAIHDYEEELKRIQELEAAEEAKLRDSQGRLESRRDIHNRVMTILDQFYGNRPGWEDDPISQKMFPETAEMTEAGLEAERDLAEVYAIRELAYAAYEDHGRALNALKSISLSMRLFIEQLEKLLTSIDDCQETCRIEGGPLKINGTLLTSILRDLGKLLHKCVQSGKVAHVCCIDAPRVAQISRDLDKLNSGFGRDAEAVKTYGTIYQNDFTPTLLVAKTILCDCKLAETFVSERQNLIATDIGTYDGRVERCEEYVMLERLAILDVHHPVNAER